MPKITLPLNKPRSIKYKVWAYSLVEACLSVDEEATKQAMATIIDRVRKRSPAAYRDIVTELRRLVEGQE